MPTPSSASVPNSATGHRAWATASHAEAADTSPGELLALGMHVDRCNGSRGRLFGLQCAADSVLGFMAPRLVTIMVVLTAVLGVLSIVA